MLRFTGKLGGQICTCTENFTPTSIFLLSVEREADKKGKVIPVERAGQETES